MGVRVCVKAMVVIGGALICKVTEWWLENVLDVPISALSTG